MPSKSVMRDNVSAVRSRLPKLANLSREKIELALLYYESNVDETVEAFERDGAADALIGWTEKTNDRGNNANKRSSNKTGNVSDRSSTSQVPSSNGPLRPSQRVSHIFQTFADGRVPTITTNNENSVVANGNHQFYPTNDSLCFSQTSSVLENHIFTTNSSVTDVRSLHESFPLQSTATSINNDLNNTIDETNQNNSSAYSQTNGHHETIRSRKGTHASEDLNGLHSDQKHIKHSTQVSGDNKLFESARTNDVSTVNNTTHSVFVNDNRKALTKSAKDLQRQTSTLSNVEMLFENEIKTSTKRIGDIFKQMHEILKEREVQLYLEMDKVKEHGMVMIRRRQQRATELRQRVDRCDCLQPPEVDDLRTDIKKFVTDRRYDLGEELQSSHRFEFDQNIIDLLTNFGKVYHVDRPRTISTSSNLHETNGTPKEHVVINEKPTEVPIAETASANIQTSNVSLPSNIQNNRPALPQRRRQRAQHNPSSGDHHVNFAENNGYQRHFDDSNGYQTVQRRRTAPPPSSSQQQTPSNFQNGNQRRQRQATGSNTNHYNNNNNQNYQRRNGAVPNSENGNNSRRLRSAKTTVPPTEVITTSVANS